MAGPTVQAAGAEALLLLDAAPALLPTFDALAVRDDLRASFVARAPVYRGDTIREGRAFRLEVGVGTVALRAFDPARAEERDNPEAGCFSPAAGLESRHDAFRLGEPHYWIGDAASGYGKWLNGQDEADAIRGREPSRRSRVTEWSVKSRARMLRAFAELDYRAVNEQPGHPAMVTLTYPGEWLSVAPTFSAVKRHLRLLRKRWYREFGWAPAGLWKLEFQARGAPHFHFFASVPALTRDGRTFEDWLASTWADLLDHQDQVHREGGRRRGTHVSFGAASTMTDPRRLAVYFLKHGVKNGGKEYQNAPPDEWGIQADPVTGEVTSDGGTGRFWGYWGMTRSRAAVDVPARDFYRLRRILRRWRTAQGQAVRLGVMGRGGGNSGGWALVNDGPAFAALLSRALAAMG